MVAFVTKPIEIEDYASIAGAKTGDNIYWYIRMYHRDAKKSVYRSLYLPYSDNSASIRAAKKAGRKKYKDFIAKVKVGISPIANIDVSNISDEYFKHISSRAEENDAALEKGQRPKYAVKGGKGFYSVRKCKEIEPLLRYLDAYWKTLPTKDMGAITFNQLEKFNDWMNDNYDLSPSRRAKCITQIRMIWRYGRQEEYVNWIPNPSRPPQETSERTRRNLQEEEWLKMEEWAREQIAEVSKDKYARKEQIDSAYQFYLWFQVISWTGIRPPNGSVKKNFLKWASYKVIKRKGETEKRLFERDEKEHKYTAIIHPQGWKFFDALELFHKKRGTYTKCSCRTLEQCTHYLFSHTQSKEGSYSARDPINNFYKQWDKMLIDLGLDMPKGTMQKDKLVPYSLRGYYITMRLRYGKGLSIDKLALSCGTSSRIIRQAYYDFSSEKEYDELTANRSDYEDAFPEVKFDKKGFLAGLTE